MDSPPSIFVLFSQLTPFSVSLCLSLSQVGPYPEDVAIYKERAPIENLDKLSAPLILFQGLEDKIVPPNQAQMMYDICLEKKIPSALEMFEGEQHGFRQSKNIRRALEAELLFYGRVFGFAPADPIEPFDIDNI